jgi:predicted metalloendopeptidase
MMNQPAIYGVFGVNPDDKMYLAPKHWVIIWKAPDVGRQ